jgi:hypothetical protein
MIQRRFGNFQRASRAISKKGSLFKGGVINKRLIGMACQTSKNIDPVNCILSSDVFFGCFTKAIEVLQNTSF